MHVREYLCMRPADFFPVAGDVDDIHPGARHVIERGAGSFKADAMLPSARFPPVTSMKLPVV